MAVGGTYHLVAGQPVSLLLDAGLGAFAADSEGLHHQAVLHRQAQLPGGLLGVHAEHTTQVPAQEGWRRNSAILHGNNCSGV